MAGEENFLDDEWYMVRHSGEMPEVALHSSLYFLTEDEDGPQLSLTDTHLLGLKEAAMARYCDIILRDLSQENRHSSIYRGVQRAIINYQRLLRFCRRQQLQPDQEFHTLAGQKLIALLAEELRDRVNGKSVQINCSFQELTRFATELGLGPETLPSGVEELCAPPDPSGAVAIV